jgi:hypothetical protein
MSKARDELVHKIRELGFVSEDCGWRIDINNIVDFITEDRKRIVEPLVKHEKLDVRFRGLAPMSKAVNKTLKNAGVL